mgnify:CR=1 FL=1
MESAGNDFLAGTGFPQDENRAVGTGGPECLIYLRQKTARLADEPLPPAPAEDNVWARGEQLPLDYATGGFGAVAMSLWALAKSPMDWLPAEA